MPQPLPAGFKGLSAGQATPQDAFAAFQRRGLLQPSFRWQEVWHEEHSRAFAVAGVSRLDVLKVIQDAVEPAVRDGQHIGDFAKGLKPLLQAKGFWGEVEVSDPKTGQTRITRFDDARLRLIYDTNLRQSNAAGRWASIERNKARQPFVTYRTMGDDRVRPLHQEWNGVTLPVDHAWWNTHFPPCGWRCRCQAYGMSQRDVDRARADGRPVKTEPPPVQYVTYVNPSSGEIVPVPRGIDPGWGYNPGKARDAALYDSALRKSLASSPLAGATVVAKATVDHAAMVAEATREFGTWVDAVLGSGGQAQGALRFVGALQPAAVRALASRGIEPATAALAVRDADVLHALRDAKAAAGAAVPVAVYRRLPELLARASAVLLERGDGRAKGPALLYVVDLVREDGSVAKLVVQLDQQSSGRHDGRGPKFKDIPLNIVRTGTVMDPQTLRDTTRYELLWGRLT